MERLDVINGNDVRRSNARWSAVAGQRHNSNTSGAKTDLPKTAFSSKLLAKTDMTSSYQQRVTSSSSARANAKKVYIGNAFDNPHRNGGTLPRQQRSVTSSSQGSDTDDQSGSFIQPNETGDGSKRTNSSQVMTSSVDAKNTPDLISGLLGESLRKTSSSSAKDVDPVTSQPSVEHIMATVTSHELELSRSDASERMTSAQQQRHLSEQEINRSWEQIVSAAELVNGNGDLMDLIKYVDQDDSDRSACGDVTRRAATFERAARRGSAANDSKQVETGTNTDTKEALSFTNPVFGQVFDGGSLRKQRHFPVTSPTDANSSHHQLTSSHSSTVSSSQSHSSLASQSSRDNTNTSANRDQSASYTSSLIVAPSTPTTNNNVTELYDNHSLDDVSNAPVTSSQVCRQTEPPRDLQFAWSRSKSIHESPDTRWTDLNTPQSRVPLATSLPSQALFLSPMTTPSLTPPQQPPRHSNVMTSSRSDNCIESSTVTSHTAASPSYRSATDDYVTLTIPPLVPMTSSIAGASRSTHMTSVRMGLSSVQRRATPTDTDKQRMDEEELTSLRDQLAQTQRHLTETEERLKEEERNRVKVGLK